MCGYAAIGDGAVSCCTWVGEKKVVPKVLLFIFHVAAIRLLGSV